MTAELWRRRRRTRIYELERICGTVPCNIHPQPDQRSCRCTAARPLQNNRPSGFLPGGMVHMSTALYANRLEAGQTIEKSMPGYGLCDLTITQARTAAEAHGLMVFAASVHFSAADKKLCFVHPAPKLVHRPHAGFCITTPVPEVLQLHDHMTLHRRMP